MVKDRTPLPPVLQIGKILGDIGDAANQAKKGEVLPPYLYPEVEDKFNKVQDQFRGHFPKGKT